MRKALIKSDSTIKPELPKPELPRKALLHAETPATKDAVRVPIEAETLPIINPTVLNVSEREETCGPPGTCGLPMAEFHQGGGFRPGPGPSLERFLQPVVPAWSPRPGSLSPKVKPVIQLLFALEGSM